MLDLVSPDIRKQLRDVQDGRTRLWRVYWITRYPTHLKPAVSVFLCEIFAPFEWVAREEAYELFDATTHNERQRIWVGENAPWDRPILTGTRAYNTANPSPAWIKTDKTQHHEGALTPWQTARVKALIYRNLSRHVTLLEMTKELGLSSKSRPYVVRAFKAAVGKTPYQWLLKKRIEQAQRLLTRTEKSIQMIAGEVGYPDYTAFTRVFSRQVGLPPSRYRSNAQKDL